MKQEGVVHNYTTRTCAEKKMQSHVGTALTLAKPSWWRLPLLYYKASLQRNLHQKGKDYKVDDSDCKVDKS
jgi:hypothetical protein